MKDSCEYNLPEFSHNKWLQIVFAYKNDCYYTSSLLKLDLYQYLWLSLRQNHDAVWFVSVTMPKETIKVKHFTYYENSIEKKSANSFTNKKLFFVKKLFDTKKAFNWIMGQTGQLDNEKRQAFIMEQESFISLFKNRELNDKQKKKLKNHTIVLLLPPEVQGTKELLLQSPAFEKLDAEFVMYLRNSMNENNDIYRNLNERCSDVCLFLHEFTKERMERLLNYSLVNHAERDVSPELVECMAAYMTQYLNNRSLQWSDENNLFDRSLTQRIPMYKDIEHQLNNDSVWHKLQQRTEEVRNTCKGSYKEAIRQYIENRGINFVSKCIYMLPIPDSVKDYYLNIDPYNQLIAMSSIPENLKKNVLISYENLYHLAYTTGNHQENGKCVDSLGKMINEFIKHQENPEIYFRYLICIEKYMNWLYEKNNTILNDKLRLLENYMSVVIKLFDNIPNWNEDMQQTAKKMVQELDKYLCTEFSQENIKIEFIKKMNNCQTLIGINTNTIPMKTSSYLPDIKPSTQISWFNS